MPEVQVRKNLTAVEEIFHEGGPVSSTPLRRAAALAVIHNPFAGSYVNDIAGFMDDLKPLGLEMARSLVAALGGNSRVVEGYGKGAIVGASGELEHGALWHVPGGYAMRELLGGARTGRRPARRRNPARPGDDHRPARPRPRRRPQSVRNQRRRRIAMTASSRAHIRKIATFVEETNTEMGRPVNPPTRRAAAVAVIENPCAGKYVEDLSELMTIGEELGELLTLRAVAALGIPADKVESYGKAAAVGENGEIEHAAAILHPKLGAPVRKVLGKGAALIPSSKKRGGMGVALDIPLGHKDAAFVRSHFDGMEVRINDAPRANEIMVAVAVTDSGRPLARVGGLTKDQIKGEDGLR